VLGPILTLQEYLNGPGQVGRERRDCGPLRPRPGSALYTSTKGALTTVTKIAANELGARGIRVNAIAPGAADTEGARELGLIGGDMVEQLTSSTPFGRIGYPEDIGPVAAFLASDDARWITGDVVFAAGGHYYRRGPGWRIAVARG
jgi:3-oxoacyl-[acyl-carrier protein] reductase